MESVLIQHRVLRPNRRDMSHSTATNLALSEQEEILGILPFAQGRHDGFGSLCTEPAIAPTRDNSQERQARGVDGPDQYGNPMHCCVLL
eukprot:1521244-Amphidinium_carterae.1